MNSATVFQHVRIFDGVQILSADTLIVQAGIIAAIGKDLALPTGATVIECRGQTVLPGFIDAHTHTLDPAGLWQALIFGVTTELDMFTDWHLAAKLKASQQTNVTRADIYSAGTVATAPGGHGTQFSQGIPTITEPEEAQTFVDARIAEGSDYIKIMYDDCAYETGQPWPKLRKDTLAAVVAAAHHRGKLAVVHAVQMHDARDAIEVGADGLAHLFVDQLPDVSFSQQVVAAGAFVVPTLAILEYTCGIPDNTSLLENPALAPYFSPADRDQLQRRPTHHFGTYTIAEEMVRQLRAANVPLLAGTDAPLGPLHGAGMHREVELLVRAGLTPLEALVAATSTPARVFGLTDRGRIALGLRADLVLVNGDPTSDIRTTRSIQAVWKLGEVLDREKYQQQLAQDGKKQP